MKLGMDMLRFMKEELGFVPSRKCLDFLLHACVNAKDMENGLLVWKEYQSAALPCNVLSFLRQATLLSPFANTHVQDLYRNVRTQGSHILITCFE